MSDLVGNPEDRFSHNEAHFKSGCVTPQYEHDKVKSENKMYTKNVYLTLRPDIRDTNSYPCTLHKRFKLVMHIIVGFFHSSRHLVFSHASIIFSQVH